MSSLAEQFTEEEVLRVIRALPSDKALGPDGFIARFLQLAWEIVRVGLMAALDAFWHMDTRNFHAINEALMVLLPKSAEAMAIKDFQPISLIHVLGKLISKLLGMMIRVSQSAFVKGRFIQDNFKVVQGIAKLLHARR
jgi:hypothetical protein